MTTDTDVPRADPGTRRALIDEFGMDPKKVDRFGPAKAETVLHRLRLERYRDRAHGAARAADQEAGPRPLPAGELTMRRTAAEYLRQALAADDPDELLFALSYSFVWLTAGELRDLVPLLIAALRTDPTRVDDAV